MSKKNKETATATAAETAAKEVAPAGTSKAARIKAMFLRLAQSDKVLSAIDFADEVRSLAAEAAVKRMRSIPIPERITIVDAQIAGIYEDCNGDFSALADRQDELQALFVKKQNLERRLITETNKAASEAA